MLYQVRLQYSIHVDATDNAQAFRMACKAMRDNPGSHIAKVAQAAAPKRKTSLVKRLITGQ